MTFLRDLTLTTKFTLLGLLALLMTSVPSALYFRQTIPMVASAQLEHSGLAPMTALQDVVRQAQKHRGLSAGMLGGNAKLEALRPETRDALTAAADRFEALLKAGASAARQAQWAERRQHWVALEQAVAARQLKPAESSARHTALIAELLALNDGLLDDFALSLDPRADSYALIQAALVSAPALTERLGQLRAQGTGFLATGQLPPEGRATLIAVKSRAQELYGDLIGDIGKATAVNADLKAQLGDKADGLKARIAQTLALAEKDLIQASALSLAPDAYFQTFTETIDAVYGFNGVALAQLSALLEARTHDLRRTQWLVVAGLAGMLLAAVALALTFARGILRDLGGEPAYARDVVQRIAAGDMSQPIRVAAGGGDSLLGAMAQMQASLSDLVAHVRQSSESLATASAEIAQGNLDLSGRTEQQASGLQATASAMDELNATVGQNADNAQQARQLALSAAEVAARGGQAVGEVVETMKGINASSNRIAEIIGTIDGIAFQTNILALNAAVEAARAGEQGRGFAVVASEVRSLAQRSGEAAREIRSLINASVERVAQGTAQVDQAGTTMTEVVSAVQRMTDIMGEISAASDEQRTGVAQVGESITRMDQATQQNAALVEQSAAATDSLEAQARQLVQAVAVFRLSPAGHAV